MTVKAGAVTVREDGAETLPGYDSDDVGRGVARRLHEKGVGGK